MSRDLAAALRACGEMDSRAATEARGLISDLRAIKQKIEVRAATLGYSERCRESIATCRGECCRWHFPKSLSVVDFLVAVFTLAPDERKALVKQVEAASNRSYQCPLLRKDGCIFVFENRPVVCTSAFPCLAESAYWHYKETFREEIDKLRAALGRLIDGCVG